MLHSAPRLIFQTLVSLIASTIGVSCGHFTVSRLPFVAISGKFFEPFGWVLLAIFMFVFLLVFAVLSRYHFAALLVAAGITEVGVCSRVIGGDCPLPASLCVVLPIVLVAVVIIVVDKLTSALLGKLVV